MSSTTGGDEVTFRRLLKRWKALCALSVLFSASGYALLRLEWGANYAMRWLLFSTIGLLYLLITLGRNLKTNHRQGEENLVPDLGWGNGLTILRGVLVAGLAGFLFSPRPESWLAWMPVVLYTLSDATDFLDGYVARRTNQATRLGEILDMSLDGMGVLVVSILAVQYEQVPAWYLFVALARYLFLAGLWLRKKLNLVNHELPYSISRRVFAGLQMGFLAVILWPIFSPPGTYIAAAVFSLPFLAGFVVDWFYASGMVEPGRLAFSGWVKRAVGWLPVGFRLFIIVVSMNLLVRYFQDIYSVSFQLQVFVLLEFVVLVMIVAGAAGRAASILGMLLIGFFQMQESLALSHLLLVPAYAGVLFMGSGPLSLWKPEDALVFRRAGEHKVMPMEQAR